MCTYRRCIDAIFHSTRCQGRYGRRPNLGLWRLLEVDRGGEVARRDGWLKRGMRGIEAPLGVHSVVKKAGGGMRA